MGFVELDESEPGDGLPIGDKAELRREALRDSQNIEILVRYHGAAAVDVSRLVFMSKKYGCPLTKRAHPIRFRVVEKEDVYRFAGV